jgi:hypothetical protein
VNKHVIRTLLGIVEVYMDETHRPPKLPEGYRLDLTSDPDAPALRRPDGTVVARFSARGMTHETIEREALEDLLVHTGHESRGGEPHPLERPRRPRRPT